ncbi:fused putative transporter subunits of ABC superfamily: ATP-binding components [Georgfuchsia toluolica]|uniref:Probable ATP-binding protein YheS n=1 Tax=Georgfuchsia toluolica TaxID=424218 RepID=A0A916J3G1_9PROT|nr:ATP-binding cassette domain-containing protein [Georgfuchsia toluolica]CAG4884014.1 fused putative transporter subunits of ABC superfamily: ATP-binding components [Georgfuchsia toluolica]
MILLRNLSFGRGSRLLAEGASLQLHPGWKVGLTGANGSGKSSFFALLRGELHAEAGDLEIPAVWTIAHVAQETPALPDAALDFVLDGDIELRQIERDLVAAEASHDGERIGALHMRYGEIDGYAAKARASALMHGLGFSDADFARAVAEFSGGWRVRLNLARALMCRSDLLLLDEPTNHLDLDAVLWLEGWLKRYQGTLMLISHDRDFLDAVADHVLNLEQNKLTLYSGNYSTFERTRAERLALQQNMYEKQQREIAHLHSYIERFRAKATKARQAQSRIKALARMEEVAAAHVDTPFTFRFRDPRSNPDPLLTVHQAAAGYGDKPIISNIQLTIRPGERIALLGANGAGKSTLIKLLAGELAPLSGERLEGKGLAIGYFAQHQLEQLRPDESPLQHMIRLEKSLAGRAREQDLRDFLGGFDFRGAVAESPCGRFSGGEKSRLALAILIWQRPNLLLLDEPTNHLDLEMREALTIALQETDAGVILVSHDRHLLRTTADTLYLVGNGKARIFDGDLDDYAKLLATQKSDLRNGQKTAVPEKPARREAPPAASDKTLAEQRNLRKEAGKLERQIAGWQNEKALLDARIADPALYANPDRTLLEQLLKRQAELAQSVETAETRWLRTQEALEILSS